MLILTETENTPILKLFPKITNKKHTKKSNSELKNNKDLKNIKIAENLKLSLNVTAKNENQKSNQSPSKNSLNENVNIKKKSLSFFYKSKDEFINYDKFNNKSSKKTVKAVNNNIDTLILNIKNNNANSYAMNDLLKKLIKVKKKINEISVKKREKVNQIKLFKHKNNNSNSNIKLNDFLPKYIIDKKNSNLNNEKEKNEDKITKKEIRFKTSDKNNFNKKNKLELKLSFGNISNNSNNNKIKAFSVRKKSNSKSISDKYDRYKLYNNYSQNIVTKHIKYIDKIRDIEFINLFKRFQKSLLKNKIEEINHIRSLVFPKKFVDKIIKMKNELTIDKYRNEYLNKIETYKYNSKKILRAIGYHNNLSINDEDTYDNVNIRLKKGRNNFNKTYENRFDKNSIKRKIIKNLNNNMNNVNNYNSEFVLDLNCN